MPATLESIPVHLFWAERDRDSLSVHPLLCHPLGVGAVTWQIWQSVLPPAARRTIAVSLDVDEVTAGRWVNFWSACHDLGKLSPPFQLQDQLMRTLLEAAGFAGRPRPHSSPHGTITTTVLLPILTDGCRWPPRHLSTERQRR